ncbi:hypothetical protein EV2_025678 [Malus domestica]
MAPAHPSKAVVNFFPPQMILKAQSKPKSLNTVHPKITASMAVALSPAVIHYDVDRDKLGERFSCREEEILGEGFGC